MCNSLVKTGLLVVTRIDYARDERFRGQPRGPAAGLSTCDVLRRYMGFDGELWPEEPGASGIRLENGLAPLKQINRVRLYYESLQSNTRCDLLAIGRADFEESLDLGGERFELLGYDFGYIESEYNFYSFLFHEIIYARFDEFKEIASTLNQHLLLESLDIAKEISKILDALELRGERLETSDSPEVCVPIAVLAPCR
jgi:hypothetical protein